MGVCLPKSTGAQDKSTSKEENPSEASSKVPMDSAEPGSPKSRAHAPVLDDGDLGDDLTSPAPDRNNEWQAPAPPVMRKRSLQMDPADMSKFLTQVAPGTPMSPKRSPEISPGGHALLPPPALEARGKRCLAIDLDETLVHTERQPCGFAGGKYDFQISVRVGGSTFPMYVKKRPGCDNFLRKAAEDYELIIFTASVEAYCNAVMEKIDPHGYTAHSLNRTHCTFHQNEIFVKDLSRLGRSLKDTILLDNNADCYLYQPENAIPINSWYDDESDTDLDDVLGILDLIAKQKKTAVATLAEIDDKLGWQRRG